MPEDNGNLQEWLGMSLYSIQRVFRSYNEINQITEKSKSERNKVTTQKKNKCFLPSQVCEIKQFRWFYCEINLKKLDINFSEWIARTKLYATVLSFRRITTDLTLLQRRHGIAKLVFARNYLVWIDDYIQYQGVAAVYNHILVFYIYYFDDFRLVDLWFPWLL